ncbi:redoxin domain-containing protein [Aneurinibacillus aneurinilyticus]|uniref:redoxin domain-containing protein n=1 Tax=Aneurinibacillus aneurinilyticus TaxID=1391 RepID=UPI0023F56251|nr:redoxin domain-containing protein [Aneurinibacillus aneurinilyticus]
MEALQLGPLLLKISWILLFVSGILAFAVMYFRLRKPDQSHKKIIDSLLNAAVLAIFVWKFSIVLFEPSMLVSNPSGLLYFNGGQQGIWLAALVALLYVLYRARKMKTKYSNYAYAIFVLLFISFSIYQVLLAVYTEQKIVVHLLYSAVSLALFVWLDTISRRVSSTDKYGERLKTFTAVAVLVGLIGFGMYDWTLSPSAEDNPGSRTVGLAEKDTAPNFTLTTLDGKSVSLSELRGKKVLLNFWATWCPPCRAEMPDMQKFYTKYKDTGIEIIAVNLTQTETSETAVASFIEKYGLSFIVPLDKKGEVASRFQAYTVPTSYLIDESGAIMKKRIGPMSYGQMKQLIGE